MSDNEPTTTTLTGAESAADSPNGPAGTSGTPDAENGADTESKSSNPNREAAAYRVKLREAEGKLQSAEERFAEMQGRLAELQRAEVERIAGETLSQGSDLLGISGHELSAYLTEGGGVDAAKVAEAAAELLSTRPGLRKTSPAFDPTQGSGGNASGKSQPGWGDLLK